MGIELVKKQGNINLTAPKAILVDLSNYYTKTETDGKIQEAVNAIPEVDLSNYTTKDYVSNALTPYAKTSEIPDTSSFITEIPAEYVTESELTAKGYLTQHQSLDGYATKVELNEAIAGISQEEHNFIINIVKESNKYTCDKTFAEIQTAFESGKILFVDFMVFGMGIHYMYLYSTNYTVLDKKYFIFFNAYRNTNGINIITIREDGAIEDYINAFAKTEDIPDVSAFQTEAQVNTLISNALNAIGVAEFFFVFIKQFSTFTNHPTRLVGAYFNCITEIRIYTNKYNIFYSCFIFPFFYYL